MLGDPVGDEAFLHAEEVVEVVQDQVLKLAPDEGEVDPASAGEPQLRTLTGIGQRAHSGKEPGPATTEAL